ncbi:MAG: hypothetical protein AABX75_02275 [Nanoarchaeota archaeon]
MESEILRFGTGLLVSLLPILRKELSSRIEGELNRLPDDMSAIVTQENMPWNGRDTYSRIVDIYVGVPTVGLATPYLRVFLGTSPVGAPDLRVRTTEGTIDNFFSDRLNVAGVLKAKALEYCSNYRAQALAAEQEPSAPVASAQG